MRLSLLAAVVVSVLVWSCGSLVLISGTNSVSCGTGTYNGEYCGYSSGNVNGLGRCSGSNCALFTSFCQDHLPCVYNSWQEPTTALDVTQGGNGATNYAAECVLETTTFTGTYFCAYSSCSGVYNQAFCAFPATGSVGRQVGTCTGGGTCAIGVHNALNTAVIQGCAANNAPAGTPCLYGLTDSANYLSQCTTSQVCGVVSCPYGGAKCNTAPNTNTGKTGTCSNASPSVCVADS